MPVLYSKCLSGPEYTLAWEWSPMNGPEQKCCWKGHLRHYPDLGREADDSDMLVVTGTVTQICVEDTVRSAFHEGLRTVVVEDAVSSFDEELHRVSLRGMGMKYARVLGSEAVLGELRAG